MLHGVEPERGRHERGAARARQVIDGVRVGGGGEIWCFLARDEDDPAAWLFASAEPVTVCRRVGRDGELELGHADPDLDELVSDEREPASRG